MKRNLTAITALALIMCIGASCSKEKETAPEKKDATVTWNCPNPMKSVLGKTDDEIRTKMDALWNHYFISPSGRIYQDCGDGTAYILDANNNDVRSYMQAWGMMICVQTDHKFEFDRLWKFAKDHMLHTEGNPDMAGRLSWQVSTSGATLDSYSQPDAEIYCAMSLLFASHRWGDSGTFDYNADAQFILGNMWRDNDYSLFNETTDVIVFQPGPYTTFTDPAYNLPAFLTLFSLWSDTDSRKFAEAATAARNHLYSSSHSTSGLFPEYNSFDGIPHWVSFSDDYNKYMYEAMRCAMNFGTDYYLTGKDAARQKIMAARLIDFFDNDGYSHARFNWDGTGASENYTIGEAGTNAVACICLMDDPDYSSKVLKNMQLAWEAAPMTSQYRSYDGLVHYLSMLHLCGMFKIWE